MKTLLDECLPKNLRKHLAPRRCGIVAEAGFSGKSNGELLTLAESSGWQVLLTIDRGIPYQQNLTGQAISVVLILARSNRIADLLPRVPDVLRALRSIEPGQVVQIG